jgi:AraC-like DNA-binding protein
MPMLPQLGFHDSPESIRVMAETNRVAIGGRLGQVPRHRLSAPAVVVGVDRTVRVRSEYDHEGRAFLVRPGCWHSIDAADGRIAVFFLPPHALRSDRLDWVRELPHAARWFELGEALLSRDLSAFEPIDRCVAREHLDTRPIDDRLRVAIRALEQSLDQNLAVDDLAAIAHLSASRLMALAHEQLGTSLRAYRRWLRAFRVVRDYAAGLSLTEAAFSAGFASSAHLSASARDQFGIRPSDVLRPQNRARIHVVEPARAGS